MILFTVPDKGLVLNQETFNREFLRNGTHQNFAIVTEIINILVNIPATFPQDGVLSNVSPVLTDNPPQGCSTGIRIFVHFW